MFGCLRNCGIDLEIYHTSILSAVLAFIPHFPGGSGKSEMPKSTSGLTSALIYFLFGLFKHAFSGNKRHICSLERQITRRWSPDIILSSQGKQKRELRTASRIYRRHVILPLLASQFFHIDDSCLFKSFVSSVWSRAV